MQLVSRFICKDLFSSNVAATENIKPAYDHMTAFYLSIRHIASYAVHTSGHIHICILRAQLNMYSILMYIMYIATSIVYIKF